MGNIDCKRAISLCLGKRSDRKLVKPYFQTKLGKLYHMDCYDFMKNLPDKSIDLILTDPPYGISITRRSHIGSSSLSTGKCKGAKVTNYNSNNWDKKPVEKKYFDEMLRVSKNQIIFGGNYYTDYLHNSSCWIVWDKDNSGYFADCELAWTSFKSAIRKIKWRWNGCLQEDMRNKEKRLYPTQKPIPVMQWILNKYAKQDNLILDPFCGSGTTAVASEITQRKWVAVDKELKACEIAKNRIIKQTKQFLLFQDNEEIKNGKI